MSSEAPKKRKARIVPNQPIQVELSGEQTGRNSGEAREKLLEALSGEGPIEIDCSGITKTDISFLQVLIGAARSAAARNVTLTCVRGSEALSRAVERSGLQSSPPFGRAILAKGAGP